jgi:4-diphosphocytidyl-2-C-methyl-D-erythritol kinase
MSGAFFYPGMNMARQFSLNTGCKINLYLKIIKQRSDGLHIIDSVFYPLSRPADQMDIIESESSGLSVKCCPANLESKQNILHKAYDLFAGATDFKPGLKVFLHKKVPMGAGLGGGSSNAASLLLILNQMAGAEKLDPESLISLAARVGADVPFFFSNKPARVKGIGDILLPCAVDLMGMKMILICPEIHVDTAWAYNQWDLREKTPGLKPHNLTISPTTDNNSPLEEQLVLSNSFEKVVFRSFPEIRKIKTSMLENGAAACVMSGSGSSLTAFFRDQASACRSCALLDRHSIPFYYYNL